MAEDGQRRNITGIFGIISSRTQLSGKYQLDEKYSDCSLNKLLQLEIWLCMFLFMPISPASVYNSSLIKLFFFLILISIHCIYSACVIYFKF